MIGAGKKRSYFAHGSLVMGAAILAMGLSAGEAAAATIAVRTLNMTVNGSDGCGLVEALRALNNQAAYSDCAGGNGSSDTVTLRAGIGTYTLPSSLPFSLEIFRNVVLRSETAGTKVKIKSANTTLREVFFIEASSPGINVEFRDIDLEGNGSSAQSGIYQFSSSSRKLTLLRSRVASFGGSGIIVQGPDLDIIDSVIEFNNSGAAGGGVFFQGDNGASLNVRSSQISYNTSSLFGGGIYFEAGGTSNIINSTIAQNSAESGAGLDIAFNNSSASASFNIIASTIAANFAADYGGGVYASGFARHKLKESIVSGNSALNGGDWFGVVSACNDSLIESTDSTTIGSGSHNLLGVSPGFMNDEPWNVGGPYTTKVMVLAPTSPAVDFNSTSSEVEDQRHFARGVDAVAGGNKFDIGAYEHDANVQMEMLAVRSKSSDTHSVAAHPEFTNGKGTNLQSNAVNDFVAYDTPMLLDGCHSISVGFRRTSNSAKVQLAYNDPNRGTVWSPIGPVLDLWARTPTFKELEAAPNIQVTRDAAQFRFQVVGRNNANTTGYQMFIDYIRIGPPKPNTTCVTLCATPPCPPFGG